MQSPIIALIVATLIASWTLVACQQQQQQQQQPPSTPNQSEQTAGENGLKIRDVNARNLRVVIVNKVDDAQQQAGTQEEIRPQKRRRLRKRKRRPQVIDGTEIADQPYVLRRRRPVRLDEVESWKEMEAESPPRPYIRRRVGPVYHPEEQPFQETKPVVEQPTIKDIKDILKQTGGLSLSEILQENNVTLADLLKGNQNAISALSERPIESMTTTTDKVEKPPQEPQQKETQVNQNERPEPRIETAAKDTKKDVDTQRKRLSQLYHNQENKIYSEVSTKFEVVTEGTTEKRIFVPSHPKLYTALNYKPEFELQTEAPKTSTSRLPITSAKLMNRKRTPLTTPQTPPKEINPSPTLGPLKMSINLEELTNHNTVIPDTTKPKLEQSTTMRLVDITTTTTTTTTTEKPTTSTETTVVTTLPSDPQPQTEKLTTIEFEVTKAKTTTTAPEKITVSAKDEIMEIINNQERKEVLSKILTSRNMTFEQLVEQRERGSSQKHLADIFHNDTKEPEATEEHVGTIVEMSSTKPPITTTIKPIQSNEIKSLEDVSMSSEEISVVQKLPSTSFPTYKIETSKQSKEIPPLHIPIWKTIYPSIYSVPDTGYKSARKYDFEDIESSIRKAVDEDLEEANNENNNNFDYEETIQIPIGVKSAIFASLAIIGMSLVLFLTILVVFKWTQKHKKKLCYGGSGGGSNASSFACAKIKSPILEVNPTRTIRTFVSETLGKRRNFYASHFRNHHHHHNVSDGWDSDRTYR